MLISFRRSAFVTSRDIDRRKRQRLSNTDKFEKARSLAFKRLERQLKSHLDSNRTAILSYTIDKEVGRAARKAGYRDRGGKLRKCVVGEVVYYYTTALGLRLEERHNGDLQILKRHR